MIPRTAIRPDSDGGGSLIDCHIQPGASRSRLVGEYAGRLKIAVAAPPVDGKANAALGRFFAAMLGIPAGRVTVVAGASGRSKRLRIAGVAPDELAATLEQQS